MGGALPCSPERVDVALPSDVSICSAKNMFLIEDCGGACKGSFLFSALERLKVGVRESGEELLVRGTGVLVTSRNDLGVGFGKGGGVATRPRSCRFAGVCSPLR